MEASLKYFIVKSDPACLYPYIAFTNWRPEKANETTLRYNPSEAVLIDFDAPPSIIVLAPAKVKPANVQHLGETGKNPQGVSFKSVRIKGWEKNGYLFEEGDKEVFVLNVDSYPEHGLPGDEIGTMMRDGFEFLDKENLNPQQVRKLLEEAGYSALLMDAEKRIRKPLGLKLNHQPERWVVALKDFVGGGVFHIYKKDLRVEKLPGRKISN